MASDFDPTDFSEPEFRTPRSPHAGAQGPPGTRAPSREEVEGRVAEAQQKLAELKRAQEELERERANLEETRRRQMEFHTGREEMIQQLTRGLALLEGAEFEARRDAEQMAKSLTDMREALTRIQAVREESWTKDSFSVELTRALTALENARMEWNSARLKYPQVLSSPAEAAKAGAGPVSPEQLGSQPLFATYTFGDLCRIGFALTWPLALVAVLVLGTLIFFLLRR